MSAQTHWHTRGLSFFPFVFSFICWLGFALVATAQQPSTTPASEILKWRIYRLGPGFFSTPDPTDEAKGWKLNPGVRPLLTGEANLFDVRSVIANSGVNQSPSGVAIFSKPAGVLVIRDTQANVDLIDTISSDGGIDDAAILKVDITLIDYTLPGIEDWKSASPLAYAELEKLAAGSIKVLDRVTAAGKSGMILAAEHLANSKSQKSKPIDWTKHEVAAFTDEETGIRFQLEPTAGPDGQIVDVNVDAQFRTPAESGNPKSSLAGKVHFASAVWNGCPVVAQSFPKPGGKGEFVALILRIDFANPGGWKLQRP